MSNEILERARIETFRQIVADACNEFYANGGSPTDIIDELCGCISAVVCKIAPPGPLRVLLQLGAVCALNSALNADNKEAKL
jgi:hypothetical protein